MLVFIELNTTFNNISGISWRSIWLVEETVVSGENHIFHQSQGTDKHYLIMLYRVHLITLVVSNKSNYHTITATMHPPPHIIYELVSDCCSTPIQQFFSYIMARTGNNQWDDDDVRFVLDQHAELDFL